MPKAESILLFRVGVIQGRDFFLSSWCNDTPPFVIVLSCRQRAARSPPSTDSGTQTTRTSALSRQSFSPCSTTGHRNSSSRRSAWREPEGKAPFVSLNPFRAFVLFMRCVCSGVCQSLHQSSACMHQSCISHAASCSWLANSPDRGIMTSVEFCLCRLRA